MDVASTHDGEGRLPLYRRNVEVWQVFVGAVFAIGSASYGTGMFVAGLQSSQREQAVQIQNLDKYGTTHERDAFDKFGEKLDAVTRSCDALTTTMRLRFPERQAP